MVTAESVKAQIVALVNAARRVTGVDSYDLTTQVNVLLSGYTGGTLATITLLATDWVAVDNLYSQAVEISGVTENSRIDLYPSATQLLQLEDDGIALTAENDSGIITIYSLHGKPSVDLEIQVGIVEVTQHE